LKSLKTLNLLALPIRCSIGTGVGFYVDTQVNMDKAILIASSAQREGDSPQQASPWALVLVTPLLSKRRR
jgi:hypothetical protein